jgi:hypothetical protein
MGREERLQLKILASSSLCRTSPITSPITINSDFWRLTFKPKMASKHENVTQVIDLIMIYITHNKCVICKQKVVGYF